jgi:hypothetical protein
MSTDVRTLNLSENDDGMVPLTTSFVQQNQPEKNVSQNKEMTMDSTPISDIMGQPEMPLEPPMMEADPRVQQPVVMQQPVVVQQPTATTSCSTKQESHSTLLMSRCKPSSSRRVLRLPLVSLCKKSSRTTCLSS